MPKASLSKREEWKRKLESWKASGLSGLKWCQENEENYPQFRYWKSILKMTYPRVVFKELKEDPPEPLELELHQGDIMITFPKGCSPSLLNLCLESLRRNQCSQ